MRPLDTFTSHTPQEEAAMVLSNQLCYEGGELLEQGRYQQALDAYRQDLQLCGETCGRDHSYFANSLYDMARCYYKLEQFDFALTLYSRAREIHEKACGPDHRLTALDISGMSNCCRELGQYQRALGLRQRHLEILEQDGKVEDWVIVSVIGDMAELHARLEQWEPAIQCRLRELALEEKAHGPESTRVIVTLIELAEAYEQLGQYERALPLRQRVLAYYEDDKYAADSKAVVTSLSRVAYCLGKLDRQDLASSMMQRAAEQCRQIYARESQRTARVFWALSEVYDSLGDSGNGMNAVKWAIRIEHAIIGTPDEDLHKGALEGELERVKAALENGATVDSRDKWGRTALIEAANHGRMEIAELLMDEGADVNCADLRGRTPLSSAIAHGHPEIFELLLQHGADTDAPGDEGRSLLMECCINNPAMFERLVGLNPDLERRDRLGKTALIYAAEWGRLEVVDALLARGAEVNAADKEGLTALMHAARGKTTQPDADYPAIVRCLLTAGADHALESFIGKTALDWAREGDELMGVRVVQEGIVELLEAAGDAE